MIKWDGHTHSKFCRHGSGTPTSKMVEKAITLGFKKYSIVEHAPLPKGILTSDELLPDFGLLEDEMPDYLRHVKELKRTYSDKIDILIGMEFDFLPDHQDFTNDLLSRYYNDLNDVVFSVHFLPGKNNHHIALDFSADVFKNEIITWYGSVEAVHKVYWEAIRLLVFANFRLPESRRIGHLNLINKFRDAVIEKDSLTDDLEPGYDLFKAIKTNGWAVDFNVNGLNQEYCRQVYLSPRMINYCQQLSIKMVYGSDAHGVDAVGQHYDQYITAFS